MSISEKYLETLKAIDDWVTISSWADRVAEDYPALLEQANEDAKNQVTDTTGLKEIAARISSAVSNGSYEDTIDVDHSHNPKKVKYLAEELRIDNAQFDKAYEALREIFVDGYPGFDGFKTNEEYAATERRYKDDLLEIYQRDALPLLESKDWDLAGPVLAGLFTVKLPSENGPQNLVGWRYVDHIRKLPEGELPNFAMKVAALLDEKLPLDQRIDQFLSFFRQLPAENQLSPAASRSIISFYLTLNNPEKYFFVKTQELGRICKRFNPKFAWDSAHIQAHEIEYLNRLGRRLFERLRLEKWGPRDLIDVQSFLWSAESHSADFEERYAGSKEGSDTEGNTYMESFKNQILYGPPGTGKTYHTVNKALEILDPEYLSANGADRPALKQRFDELKSLGRIGFVTFHQSFSYEDFVEGLRASTDNGQIHYKVEDGIFKRMCDAAAAKVQIESHQAIDVTGRRIWKMSLGDTTGSESYVYDDCISNEQLLLGYGGYIDFSGATDRKEIVEKFIEAGEEIGEYDYSVNAVNTFVNQMKLGDLVIVTDGNHKFRAIGEITGDYKFLSEQEHDRDWYWQSRPVKWHRTYSPSLPADQIMTKVFSQMTLYELRPTSVDLGKLKDLLGASSSTNSVSKRPFKKGDLVKSKHSVENVTAEILEVRKPGGDIVPFSWKMLDELAGLIRSGELEIGDIGASDIFDNVDTTLDKYLVTGYKNFLPAIIEKLLEGDSEATSDRGPTPEAWVLIIDEINRGNIANILGELITLIEPSKRAGAAEALEVILPYSKEKFSVPSNLYIIGTMNTADRSLVHIDTALRRRFQFEAMLPDINVLNELGIHEVEGIDIPRMLTTINSRIELLYDKEHTLGHSFFVPLQSNPSLETLGQIFRNQIMPLLEEYFFEDWSRIQQVLGDDLKNDENLKFYVPTFAPAEIEALLLSENNQVMYDKAFQRNEQALLDAEAFRGIYQQAVIAE